VIAAVNGSRWPAAWRSCWRATSSSPRRARASATPLQLRRVPGGGGAAILPRKVPANVAKYLLFTGDSLPADDMKTYGLVSEVVADAELARACQALGEKLAKKSPLVLAA
jgi:enoyl-CoA hydratase/carnithine racemase